MIVSSLLYAAIFGHVTTIIHNMTAATAKYHEMLGSVKEFMMLGCAPKTSSELKNIKIPFNLSKQVNNLEKHKLLKHSQMPSGPILKILVR